MPVGIVLLIGVAALVFLGVGQRILDRLNLTDKAALLFIGAMIAGSFIDIPLSSSPEITVNLGGAVIPIVLAIYVLTGAKNTREWVRAVLASLITGVAIYLASYYLFSNAGHTDRDIMDPQYLFAIIGGIVAYIAGRSRRSAFVAGVLGFLIYNLITLFSNIYRGYESTFNLGGAGIFDTMLISGLLAVVIAELIGETRERLGGGPVKQKETDHPELAGYLGDKPGNRKKKFEVKKGGKK